ncbi:type II toxin-antitoxin system VapC family toxin [Allorhizobium pseudoryzae]|uniref:type II toxin-antitoxin system VapC family toxin n=1 Tax=Allorhizobium pseudoryzae TaxID=379684 RepID=UPI003D061CE5
MFLDASALVAIIGDEPPASALLAKLEAHQGPLFYTPLVVFETVLGLARKHKASSLGEHASTPPHLIAQVQDIVEAFLDELGATEVPIDVGMHRLALDAARNFGRATGHPAKLNFGDCFAYATAKALDVPLLFVGDDFARTDITPA